MTRTTFAACFLLTVTLAAAAPVVAEELQPWLLHNSFEHFRQGTFGDAGTNTYASANGGVQMIHRWDFNNDGYLDMAVGQSHNTTDNEDAFIYWGTADGPQSLMPPVPELQPLGRLLNQIRQREKGITRLPANGGGRAVAIDLNNDGWQEIVFCNFIHNHAVRQDAYIYWGSPDGYSATKLTRLPTLSASAVAAADFNRDGFVDLCFANAGAELGARFDYYDHLESYIYWNSPRGFSEERRSSIPSASAADCAAGDVTGDGYPELVIVNNNPKGRGLYIYRNSQEGFSEQRREVRRDGAPAAVELIDVNRDKRADLIVLDRENVARIYLSDKEGFRGELWVELPTVGAQECRAADLNKDGFVDLVFPNKGKGDQQISYIYWGASDGFLADRRTELPTSWATDAAIADFNGDDWLDIALANERNEMSYDVNSYIYFNGPDGFHSARRSDFQGLGAVSAVAADLNHDDRPDLALINRYSGYTAADTTTLGALVYWGNAAHYYSPAAMTMLPTTGDCHAVADIDQDGFPDIIFPNGHVYQGSEKGFSVDRRIDIGVSGYGVNVADLNRDGHLDIVMPTEKKAQIIWGSADGHAKDRVSELPLTTYITQAAGIADLNKDGNLDLVFADVDSPRADFFWGDASGTYSEDRRTSMDVHSGSLAVIADVNRDGWLDLVFGGSYNRKNHGIHHEHGVLLFGGEDGYSLERSQRFEAYDCNEQVIADLNKDGYLDMVASNYHGHTTRSLPVFIYWGDESGTYHESRRSSLPGESTLRLTVLDFNQDGWLDIAAFNHQREGDHTAGGNIYWGGKDGYSHDRRQWFPAFGVHYGERQNLGNIYDRRLEETYISPALEIPSDIRPAQLAWQADTPHGTAVEFQVRSAKSSDSLNTAKWRGAGEAERFKTAPAQLNIPPEHRWMQYRAILLTPDGGSTPVLKEVQVLSARQSQ